MVYVCELSPEIQKIAREELNEDPKRRQDDIEHIRKWLKKQPHITARTDDWNILRFLRGCKFSLEKTKSKLETYYTCKGLIPEWFTNYDPFLPNVREILELGEILPLSGYDHKGRKVFIIRMGLHDPKKYTVDEVTKACHIMFDVCTEEDKQFSVTGIVQIMDLQYSSMEHFLQFTPPLMKKSMVLAQDGLPIRFKGLHYIFTGPTFDAIFKLFRTFMNDKLRKRVQVHGDSLERLHESVPKDILPKEYGGTNGTVEEIKEYWLQKVLEKRDWLIEQEKYKANESKRPGKPKTTNDLFGIEGSFRQIRVD